MDYQFLKLIHIISATVLFGTGIGSAFYMLLANRQSNLPARYFVVKTVVIADWLFTAPAILIQFISGLLLVITGGYEFSENWILLALFLFFFAGACWLPVVWIQIRMRNQLKTAVDDNADLPPSYSKFDFWWVLLGSLAFPAMILIFYLMIMKPEF
ncbi:MAG: DUF2269 domain-containing protein [Sneathiellales bacterium]|nr:DUF2269 domain-containing protein [Sneathiellales bacterium]